MKETRKTIKYAISEGKRILSEYSVENPALESRLLLSQATGYTDTQLVTCDTNAICESAYNRFMGLVNRRTMGEPMAYIRGFCEFMGFEFKVNENVLIPRPDTEILVEEVLKNDKIRTIIEMGCGSGAVSVALAKLGHSAFIHAVDISEKAVEITQENIDLNDIWEKINVTQSDLFKSPYFEGMRVDAIVSNPPYIPTGEIGSLMIGVKNYEPRIALDGGEDGLKFYRKIAREGKFQLNDVGYIYFEIGYNQAEAVGKILADEGYTEIKVTKDLSGHDRVVSAVFKR